MAAVIVTDTTDGRRLSTLIVPGQPPEALTAAVAAALYLHPAYQLAAVGDTADAIHIGVTRRHDRSSHV